jgi:predicted AlkP superfamily phosphohydrolase/phosphomutase
LTAVFCSRHTEIVMKNRVFIFGIDGASHEMILDLCSKGLMPNMASIVNDQFFGSVNSSIPDLSCIAWSSIITGVNPGEHGILGFMEMIPGTYSLMFPNFRNLKVKPYWETDEGKSIIINVPTTYPARPMNGVTVSGFVALDLNNAVYPDQLLPELQRLDYQVDVDTTKAHVSMELFLKDLNYTLDKRIELLHKMQKEHPDWENFMFVLTGTDRLGHFMHDAYQDSMHPFHDDFIDFYKRVDAVLGDVLEELRPEDSLILISDHGFEIIKQNAFLNPFLQENNLLDLNEEKRIKYTSINGNTKAFALDPGRIFINEVGKFPNGNVAPQDRDKVLEDLIALFSQWEWQGEKVIEKIFRKEEIYSGPYVHKAADLVLMPAPGFSLRGTLGRDEVFGMDIFTGKHRFDNAIFGVQSDFLEGMPNPESVQDVRKIIQHIQERS